MVEGVMWTFCGSEFWNNNLTWYSESPRFTPCFEKTVLVWVPFVFLWLFLCIDVFNIISSKTRNIPWNWRNKSKLIIISLMITLCIFDFCYNLFMSNEVFPVDEYTPILKVFCLLFCSALVFFHRKCGVRSSGLMFFFWFLVVLSGSSQLYSDLEHLISNGEKDVTRITYIIYWSLAVVMFLLQWLADLAPLQSDYPPVENPCPEESSSFPNRLTFSWLDRTIYLGYKRQLVTGDLWSMQTENSASRVFALFDKYWSRAFMRSHKSVTNKSLDFTVQEDVTDIGKSLPSTQSILPPLCRAFGSMYLFGASFKLMQDILTFASPQLLKCLIGFVESDEPHWRGYFYASLLLFANTVQLLLSTQYSYTSMLIGLRIKTALTSAIYRKALLLSNSGRKGFTLGEIVNLMAVDAQRFYNIIISFNTMWSVPLQIVLAVIFLWQALGPSVLAGLAILVIMIPVNGRIAKIAQGLQIKQMKYKDERVKMMNEALSGIKVLKLYAWEVSFEKRILDIRAKETKVLKQSAYLRAITSFIWSCAPFLVSLVTFATYVLIDENNILDTSKAFVSLSLFNILRQPMAMLPTMISNIIQAAVSMKRINKFLNSEELDPSEISHDSDGEEPLVMENATFSWESDEEPILHNINLRVKPGSLVAVVGVIGSGKSSLISAFLGEMYKSFGKVITKGSIAYVPQVAWIQNCTLQDNILFGNTLDSERYNDVIDACALKLDLEMLPGGDQTEIGERGINVSGGQKQRISLARAVYSDCDIYFLDDPLSAVDSHVGKHIFENVISSRGLLRNKTRLFVTHSISQLPQVDLIIVLKDGAVSEVGSYRQLLDRRGAFSEHLMTYLQEADDEIISNLGDDLVDEIASSYPSLKTQLYRQKSVAQTMSTTSEKKLADSSQDTMNAKRKEEKLIKDEKAEFGGVKWEVYTNYLRAIGPFMFSATIGLTAIYQTFSIGSNVWLSEWSSDRSLVVNGTQDASKRNIYLMVYGLLGAAETTATFLSSICWYIGAARAGVLIHLLLLMNIIRSPMSFFDTTPQGRILSRFAKDVEILDNAIPFSIKQMLSFLSTLIGTLLVISYSTPIFVVFIIPVGLVYYGIQRCYVSTAQQIKRLESVSRSPVFSHFSESVSGSAIIRAYNAQERFIKESDEKIDLNQVCTYPSIAFSRWLAIRLQMIGNFITFFSALFVVISKDSMDVGIVGLSISYALQVTQSLNFLVSSSAEVETNIVSVERIKEYSETPQESAWDISTTPVGADWPQEGKVEFINYSVRYREGLDLVLNGINLFINGGEKIGIVGRTGAGKSSVTLGLFRLIEPAGGKILIDGVDISKLGLHIVRSRLTIIPQDPVLFSGSLRMNVDPFECYSDKEVSRALELAHLETFIKGLPARLQHQVTESGQNISVGQRQLICLARALLRKTKILILDEATAAVDLETDDFIQQTIQSEFADCTVITIAHRINTIMDCDRVLVLDQGNISEFDSPADLLEDRSSAFYSMAHDAGLV